MTDKEFIYELTKPLTKGCILSFIEHDERIRALSKEPQFKDWLLRNTRSGCSFADEHYLYHGETELDRELGSRISWFCGLSEENSIEISNGYFPTFAQRFFFEDCAYWVVTVVGQGALSWIMVDKAFEKEYKL